VAGHTASFAPEEVFSDVHTVRLNQLRCLHSVDLAVRDILLKLADQGKLKNTFIVTTPIMAIFGVSIA